MIVIDLEPLQAFTLALSAVNLLVAIAVIAYGVGREKRGSRRPRRP